MAIIKADQIWDKMAGFFDTYKDNVWYGAADNIDAAWPVILNYIKKEFPESAGLKALDFGCGAGMFCRELQKLDFVVAGMDVSPEMIKIGKQNLDASIKLSVGDTFAAQKLAKQDGRFDLVTSIMVLQFIKEEDLAPFADIIKAGGHLVFVNHNPARLRNSGITDTLYLADTEASAPIYQRTTEDYDRILSGLGFVRAFEHYANQSPEFLAKYNLEPKSDEPKYLILGYKKSA
jgi:2-polyprenyl-3-methyl-5-hydroxy-6-metoxy-1,4-benzoquinol methylase